jgi:hypothetical protein
MSAVAIQQMADRVAALMEERLSLRGAGLEAKLRRAGRTLPRKLRDAATRLAEAAHNSQNPKLLLQIDMEKVSNDYDLLMRHLQGISPWDRRLGRLLHSTASVMVILVVVGAMFVAVLRWRGLI